MASHKKQRTPQYFECRFPIGPSDPTADWQLGEFEHAIQTTRPPFNASLGTVDADAPALHAYVILLAKYLNYCVRHDRPVLPLALRDYVLLKVGPDLAAEADRNMTPAQLKHRDTERYYCFVGDMTVDLDMVEIWDDRGQMPDGRLLSEEEWAHLRPLTEEEKYEIVAHDVGTSPITAKRATAWYRKRLRQEDPGYDAFVKALKTLHGRHKRGKHKA